MQKDLHLPLRTIRLHTALNDFRRDPSDTNNDRVLGEMHGPNAELFLLTRRPITEDGPALRGEDIVLMNNEAGEPVQGVQVSTGIDPVAMEHLYGGWDGIYLSLVPAKDVLRACEERGIVFLLLDKGHTTETSIGRVGGPPPLFRVVHPRLHQWVFGPRVRTIPPANEQKKPSGPMGKLRQLWHR